MKYVIPQERLDKIIFKYLDNVSKGLEKKNAMFHVGFVFKYPDEQYGILGWENHGELYIKRLFVHEISFWVVFVFLDNASQLAKI